MDKTEGTAGSKNLYSGTATSGLTGSDIVTISVTSLKKLHALFVNMANCTVGATISVRMYTKGLDGGSMEKFYDQNFLKGTDPDLIPIVTGTIAIGNDIRIEMQSNKSGDTSENVVWSYIIENDDIAAILVDTDELQTDWVNGGRLDLILDIISADTTTDIPALIATAQADLDILTGTDGVILATSQAKYAPNKVIPDIAGIAAGLHSTTDGLIGTVDGIVDRILTATEIRQSSVSDPAGAATTTKFITALTETQNDFWNRMSILFTSGNNDGQMRRIKDYNGSTKEVTLQTPLNTVPANADTFVMPSVRAFLTPDIEDISDAVLDELIADHVITGSLSAEISDKTGYVLSDVGVDAILDENIEGTHTFREMLKLFAAAIVGKSSGGGTTTVAFRDIDDTKDRIVATVTAVGNRTAITLTED